MLEDDTDAIINVLELPPKLSFNKNVSFESLYGINFFKFYSDKELITRPNVVKDLFMLAASLNLSPVAAVYFYLSLPARSTKFNLLFFN